MLSATRLNLYANVCHKLCQEADMLSTTRLNLLVNVCHKHAPRSGQRPACDVTHDFNPVAVLQTAFWLVLHHVFMVSIP